MSPTRKRKDSQTKYFSETLRVVSQKSSKWTFDAVVTIRIKNYLFHSICLTFSLNYCFENNSIQYFEE